MRIAREGDERAFEALFERHSAAIERYCRSLVRSPPEAEDVTQEVFVLAISALRRGAEPHAFRPWLYRVAHNACMSHLRVRRPVLVADDGVLVGPAAAAEPVDVHREELRQLLDDIGRLPDVQRGALLLREMDGFSYEQVGEVLGLPASTVRASIFRARRTLQGLAEARDADCEAIQAELCELADRRGRRARHITTHLHVCATCRDFRDALRRRPAVLGAADPVAAPAGVAAALLAVKGKALGGAGGGAGAAAIATGAGGAAGVAKLSAVIASSVALLAGAGLEADHLIEHSRERGASAVTRAAGAPVTPKAPRAAPSRPVLATPAALVSGPPIAGADSRRAAAPGVDPLRARAREDRPGGRTDIAERSIAPAGATPVVPDARATGPAPGRADDERSGHGRGSGDGERSGHGGRGDDGHGSQRHGRHRGSGRGEDDDGGGSDRSGPGDGSAQPRTGAPPAPAEPGDDDAAAASASGSSSGSSGQSSGRRAPEDAEPAAPQAPQAGGSAVPPAGPVPAPVEPLPPAGAPAPPADGSPTGPADAPGDPGDDAATPSAAVAP